MALKDELVILAKYIEDKKLYLERNKELFDIYQGNLLKYVMEILRQSLSDEYYQKIKTRIYPINILRRVIDKLAQTYRTDPIRTATSNQETLEYYEDIFRFNERMNTADEFSQLFKGYALKPFIHMGQPQLKVIPFDRFLTYSSDLVDPTRVTHFLEFVGKRFMKNSRGQETELDIWFVYTDEEFIAMDSEGRPVPELMVNPETGEPLEDTTNPYERIPFYYANRSEYSIIPQQDTDTLELSKLLPVQLTDLAGAIMFQCFSIVYTIDADPKNIVMSPNAFWAIKSDPQSDKVPQIGTIKPDVDVDKVLSFIKDTFSTWMETKGIRVGSIGSTDGSASASGISKIIDEMDTFEARNKSIKAFINDETAFWDLLQHMHNFWVANGSLSGFSLLPDNWEVTTEFDPPRPLVDRTTEVSVAIMERDAGVISQEKLISKLYPNMNTEELEEEMARIERERTIV